METNISIPVNKKKKILFCITKGNFGGAQRYVYDLTTSLPKDSFEIVVACGDREGTSLIQKLAEKNIRTIILQSSEREIKLGNDFKIVRELIKIVKQEKPDIIHLNSSKIGFLGAIAVLIFKSSNYRLKAIFTSHGWAFNEKNRSLISRIIFYLAHYFTVLMCDKTIAVSEKTKRDIAWLPFIKNKIVVIHNGIDSFKALPKKEAHQILAGEEVKKIIIFTLAELHLNKGVDVALKALSILPETMKSTIKYCVAGDGEEKERLQKLAKNLQIENQVKWLGLVDNGKKLLSGANIFLLPSRTENLPYSLLEAGSIGLPIIATNVGGIPEVVKDMQNGILVHSNNPKEIAEAIKYLLDRREKCKEFGHEIKSTISNFFSFKKMLEQTIVLYQ